MMGRMYSSVVGQQRLFLHTETTEGFHVTFERDRYANRLKAHTCPSNPGSARIVGSSCGTSRKWRFIGWPGAAGRSGAAPPPPPPPPPGGPPPPAAPRVVPGPPAHPPPRP